MRVLPLSAVLSVGLLGVPALAQTYAPQPAAPPAYAPPRYAPAPTYTSPGGVAPQGVPPGTSADTGARPGNPTLAGVSEPSNRGSNIDAQDTRSTVAPNLPSPDLGPGAGPQDYLRAAQNALAAGRTAEAQQALEMAETRMLDRSVPYGQTNSPIASPEVEQISRALRALAAGDRSGCMSAIQAALSSPQ
jgi:hypothetical protein